MSRPLRTYDPRRDPASRKWLPLVDEAVVVISLAVLMLAAMVLFVAAVTVAVRVARAVGWLP